MYIPKSVEGDKLEAAKKFIAFAATQEGCDAYATGHPPQGPFLSKACKLPADVSQVAKDTQAYFDSGKASPALEFLSPIKGPALEQICIQVGTGQVDGEEGRRALRPGRQEAGPAARPAGLGVSSEAHPGYCLESDSSCRRSRPGPAAGPSRKGFAMASTLSTSEATRLAPARRGLKERGKKRPGPYPYWFYVLPGAHLHGLLHRSYVRLLLLLLHPLGSVHLDLDRLGELPDLLRRAGADHRPAQHLDLCGDHLRDEGRARHGAGPAADLEDHRPRLSAVGHLLPGAGQHHRCRAHLHGVDEPRTRPDQPGAGRGRGRRARLADQPQPGVVLRSPWSTSGRASGWPRSSTSPAWSRSPASTTRRPRSTEPAAGTSSATSCCRWPGRPPPR